MNYNRCTQTHTHTQSQSHTQTVLCAKEIFHLIKNLQKLHKLQSNYTKTFHLGDHMVFEFLGKIQLTREPFKKMELAELVKKEPINC